MIRLISVALGFFALVATANAALAQDATPATNEQLFTDAERDRIRAEALAAILEYPEIIQEALDLLEERRANSALASVLADRNTPILGNPDAEVTLIEFFDYNCGYCRRMAEPLRELLAEDDNVRVVMIETPILSEESLGAAQASLAVNMLGGDYSVAHFDAMISSGRTTGDSVVKIATEMGLNEDAMRAVMRGSSVMETISRNYSAMQALEISGTPAFIVAGSTSPTNLTDINLMPGAVPVEELRAIIEMTRAGS
ncbi:DsbA family protein [Alphaproteobacteria bacterium]|nr:DsbA family protein [Alphaproteobacteria bacterium]MDG1415527.1 DsbA family protein [Alphaproteobacteria bacterium]